MILRLLALLLLLTSSSFAVVTTTTLDYRLGFTAQNKNTQIASNSTENIVIVTVTPGHAVTAEFNDSAAWYYRTTTADSTTDKPIAAAQALKLRFTATTTFYQIRQSADGTMVATLLLQE